jgi:hypothetical protein
MKKVRYVGTIPVTLTKLNLVVQPGDVIEVEDSFVNAAFEEVVIEKPKKEITKEAK